MPPARQHWLVKTEPDVYSIDDLARDKVTLWDGVRNFEARNILRDKMRKGDRVLVYHSNGSSRSRLGRASSGRPPSNADPSAIVGTAEVVREGYPDPSAFDPKNKYFDPKGSPESPKWYVVDIAHKKTFKQPVSLRDVKETPALRDMALVTRSRLSVQPVRKAEWDLIQKMGK